MEMWPMTEVGKSKWVVQMHSLCRLRWVGFGEAGSQSAPSLILIALLSSELSPLEFSLLSCEMGMKNSIPSLPNLAVYGNIILYPVNVSVIIHQKIIH